MGQSLGDDHAKTGSVRGGCLAATISVFALVTLLMFLSHFVIQRVVHLESSQIAEMERYFIFSAWLVSVAFGAYIAGRRSPSWLPNALWVGGIALLILIARYPRHAGHPEGDLADEILEMVKNPSPHAKRLVFMALVLPAALLGGFLAARRGPSDDAPDKVD